MESPWKIDVINLFFILSESVIFFEQTLNYWPNFSPFISQAIIYLLISQNTKVVIAERWRSDRTAISVEVRVPAAATKPGSFLVRGEEKALTTSKCV